MKSDKEEIDSMGFTKSELAEYDKHVKFYYTNIINALILYTFNEDELDKMASILIDPLTELYEELEYAFIPVLLETVFRNNWIDRKYKEDLLAFKKKIDAIPSEIWDWEFIDTEETWVKIREGANELLTKMGISSREYNDEFVTVSEEFKK